MREIKFKRAHFFNEECTEFSHYSEWGVGIKGSAFASPSSNNFAIYFIDYQFTGLKDRNGKDIYEGDVVNYYQPYSKKWDSHIVKWDEKFAGFGLFENNNEWCKESDWLKIQELEITGNIHEQK